MIYLAFSMYLIGMLFMGLGLWRLWTQILKPAWVNWALLPGTVVSEMAYIFGCLITGGEVRRAKLLELPGQGQGGKGGGGDSEPKAEATPRLKVLGPIIASLLAILAVLGAIVAAWRGLGEPILAEFLNGGGGTLTASLLPQSPPLGWAAFWDQLTAQVYLLRRMAETFGSADWLDWRVPLFTYLAICLAVRLGPVNRPMRPTLAAVVMAAAAIALAGAASGDLMARLWPPLTYVWTLLVFLLALTLVVRGAVALAAVIAGKSE